MNALLPLLVPRGVASEETTLARDFPRPSAQEWAQVQQAVPKRQHEFCAGRHLARAALQKLGVGRHVLLNDRDRAPVWPAGVVGSITHTGTRRRGWCGVLAAHSHEFRSVGIDVELDEGLERQVWHRVLLPSEIEDVETVKPAEQGRIAKLLFSAKECFFKLQYPLTRSYVDFLEVRVSWQEPVGEFQVRFVGSPPPELPVELPAGRYLFSDGLVLCTQVWPV